MKDIEYLLSKASGISEDLDETLESLSENLAEDDNVPEEEDSETIKELRERIEELNNLVKDLKIQIQNNNVDERTIEQARLNIAKKFEKPNEVLGWFLENYNRKFFSIVPQPAVRLAICKELIRQCEKNFPKLDVPPIWHEIVENKGLLED